MRNAVKTNLPPNPSVISHAKARQQCCHNVRAQNVHLRVYSDLNQFTRLPSHFPKIRDQKGVYSQRKRARRITVPIETVHHQTPNTHLRWIPFILHCRSLSHSLSLAGTGEKHF